MQGVAFRVFAGITPPWVWYGAQGLLLSLWAPYIEWYLSFLSCAGTAHALFSPVISALITSDPGRADRWCLSQGGNSVPATWVWYVEDFWLRCICHLTKTLLFLNQNSPIGYKYMHRIRSFYSLFCFLVLPDCLWQWFQFWIWGLWVKRFPPLLVSLGTSLSGFPGSLFD